MAEEVELKLATDADSLARVAELGLIRGMRTGGARDRHLVSTYHDTPDGALKRAGMALRVRHDGERNVQTVKGPVAGTATGDALQHMREADAEVAGPHPEIASIPDAELRERLNRDGIPDALTPQFTTALDRRELEVTLHGSRIEVAIDSGEIVAGEARQSVNEVELELKDGDPAALHELGRMLAGYIPVRPVTRSKAARGHDLATGRLPPPMKAPKPALSPGVDVAEAFATHARACMRQIRANIEAVFANPDPEGIHKLRVGLRRLRVIVDVFQPVMQAEHYAWLRGELRAFQRRIGPAREWDVFVTETLAAMRHRLPEEDALAPLEHAAGGRRADANAAASAAIADGHATHVLLTLEGWLHDGAWRAGGDADPVGRDAVAFARERLDAMVKKARKLGKKHHKLSDAKLHRLRIRLKKLRYTADAFAGLFPDGDSKTYLTRLETLQDTLGALNDAATGDELLAEIRPRLADDQGASTATIERAVGVARGWLAGQAARDLAALPKAWSALANTQPFWRDARA